AGSFVFSSRRRHTRWPRDWSSDVCSSDLDKMRLDFNENTAGCSPAVRRALGKLTRKQLAMYPEYQAPTRRISRYLGVRTEELLLDRKSTRLNSSHVAISYAVFCLKKKIRS